jgi:hypothetical protein
MNSKKSTINLCNFPNASAYLRKSAPDSSPILDPGNVRRFRRSRISKKDVARSDGRRESASA